LYPLGLPRVSCCSLHHPSPHAPQQKMPPLLPFAFASIAALAVISSADPSPAPASPTSDPIVRAHVRWALFATTEPAIATVRFSSSAGGDGWTSAEAPARVSSEANFSHVITIAEVTPCVVRSSPADDSPTRTAVQWSSDRGAHWNNLTTAPRVASPVERPGLHAGVLSLRYRARGALHACTARVVYTAIPAR
jgi:hypothetical protein